MKTLPLTFTESGWSYTQLARKGRVAIYRKVKQGGLAESFEVIRIQSHNGYKIAGKDIPASETYPCSNSWGTNGWSCITREAADAKFQQLWMKEAMA